MPSRMASAAMLCALRAYREAIAHLAHAQGDLDLPRELTLGAPGCLRNQDQLSLGRLAEDLPLTSSFLRQPRSATGDRAVAGIGEIRAFHQVCLLKAGQVKRARLHELADGWAA